MEVTQSNGHLNCVELRLLLREISFLSKVREELSSPHKIEDKENLVLGLEDVLETNQEWMIHILENLLLQVSGLYLVILKNDILPQSLHGIDIVFVATGLLLYQKHLSKTTLTYDCQNLEIRKRYLFHLIFVKQDLRRLCHSNILAHFIRQEVGLVGLSLIGQLLLEGHILDPLLLLNQHP